MFLKSSFIFSTLTFLSRIFGFVRDMLLASSFGTTVYGDVFNVAFKFPNFFRSLFAEGAFSATFMPLFTSKFTAGGKHAALKFASDVLGVLCIALLILVALFEIAMPFAITLIAPGFGKIGTYEFDLAVLLTRITTPYLIFISLVTFYSCILNSVGKFASMAASPIILNMTMIVALCCFKGDVAMSSVFVSWSVFVGGILQLIAILYPVLKNNMLPALKKPVITKDIKTFFKTITPAAMSSSITQINLWVGTIIATSVPGAVSTIYYADRIIQLPIALIGVSIGIVILPLLAKYYKQNHKEKAVYNLNRAIEIALLLSVPCAVVILGFAKHTVHILFERGSFSSADTANVTMVLLILGSALPFYIISKILVSAFFSTGNTKDPFKVSLVCISFNIAASLASVKTYGYFGIAASTALTGLLNALLFTFYGYKRKIFQFDFRLISRSFKIIMCGILLYIFLLTMSITCSVHMSSPSKLKCISVFVANLAAGSIIYVCAILLTRAYSLKDIKELMTR